MNRLPTGGRIDRTQPLGFSFNQRQHIGYTGDTLASALIANGIRIVSRSASYGRPRGIFAAGIEEPNAFVEVSVGFRSEPMLRATQVELYEGLQAVGINGRGSVSSEPDADRFDKVFAHCDVLIVGGGSAGLAAAIAAGRARARVIIVDEQAELGGRLLSTTDMIDHRPAAEWVADIVSELCGMPEVRILSRATAFGYYDHNCLLVAERLRDHLRPAASERLTRQRLWQVRAKRVVLATGSHERSIVFAENDRPGVMLAGAAQTYVNRYAAAPGQRAVVFTNNDSAYGVALDLKRSGVAVVALVDVRLKAGPVSARAAWDCGMEVLPGHVVVETQGNEDGLRSVAVAPLDSDGVPAGPLRHVDCDLLCVSGGFNPTIHLFSQSQGALDYDERLACFRPGRAFQAVHVVGAANGTFGLGAGIQEGLTVGAMVASLAGFASAPSPSMPVVEEIAQEPMQPCWLVARTSRDDGSTHFVDLERDVTIADIDRALGTGMRSIEHIKRFTTIGTGSDQGKTAGVISTAIIAAQLGQPASAIGTTTFRPPYTPVAFGLLAGRTRGRLFDPVRVTSIHPWHVAHEAVFENVGQWKRPWFYPHAGESMEAAVLRECRAARQRVAVVDASTLGKIDIQGPDSLEFLNRIYTNAFDTLGVGSCRYGLMCRADGMVFDDGVVMRLGADRYLVTTTTGGASAVLDWMEEWLQTEWTYLRVRLTSVTDQWGVVAIVGPYSREVLARIAPDIALDAQSFPFMAIRESLVAGIQARVCRVSFSGELAFEVWVASWYSLALWQAVMAAGEVLGITPYGTGTMLVLRAEKGYVIVGQDTDGTVTPQDLGMGWIVSKKKDSIGRRSHRRADTVRADRKHLVGLLPADSDELLEEGAQLVLDPRQPPPVTMVGHVTSSYRSATLGRTFALGLVESGRERVGSTVYAPLPDRVIAATVTEPIFYDKEGRRRDG